MYLATPILNPHYYYSIVAKFSNHSSGTLSQTLDHTLDHTQNLNNYEEAMRDRMIILMWFSAAHDNG